jgi:hypothetical protein
MARWNAHRHLAATLTQRAGGPAVPRPGLAWGMARYPGLLTAGQVWTGIPVSAYWR